MRKSITKQFMQKTAGLVWGGVILLISVPASAQDVPIPGPRDLTDGAQDITDGVGEIFEDAGDRLNENLARFASHDGSCCNNGCCNNGLDLGLDLPRMPSDLDLGYNHQCCLGEPWKLSDRIFDSCCGESAYNIGGWTQWGWHSESNGLYNNHDSRFNNHQSWLYAEKVADGSCGLDWGFRGDILYGVDAQDTQAFGSLNDSWDNDWDNGIYGWAIPQLYVELASGNWRVKGGKFFTHSGYEVVAATGNFFYSHAYTTYNSEPFTYTGFLASYSVSDDLDLFGGWTAGWDTGFEHFNEGSQFHGGFVYDLGDNTTFNYMVNAGAFGLRGEGFQHSLVLIHGITDRLEYVFQNDVLDTNNGDDHSVGVNQYLLYTISDCLRAGTRVEWWKFDGNSQYAWTWGLNYKPHANVILRPEVRHDWNPSGTRFNGDGKDNFTTVAMDAILTF